MSFSSCPNSLFYLNKQCRPSQEHGVSHLGLNFLINYPFKKGSDILMHLWMQCDFQLDNFKHFTTVDYIIIFVLAGKRFYAAGSHLL